MLNGGRLYSLFYLLFAAIKEITGSYLCPDYRYAVSAINYGNIVFKRQDDIPLKLSLCLF